MGLSGTGKELGDKIAAKIIASDADPDVKTAIISRWEDIGEIIVKHIISNAAIEISQGIAVSTTGTAAAQSGSTIAKGQGKIV